MNETPWERAEIELNTWRSDQRTREVVTIIRRACEEHAAEQNAALAGKLSALERHHNLCRAELGCPSDDVMLERIKELTAKLEAARKALDDICNWCERSKRGEYNHTRMTETDCYDIVREALAAMAEPPAPASLPTKTWMCPICGHTMTEAESKGYKRCPTGVHRAQHVPAPTPADKP